MSDPVLSLNHDGLTNSSQSEEECDVKKIMDNYKRLDSICDDIIANSKKVVLKKLKKNK